MPDKCPHCKSILEVVNICEECDNTLDEGTTYCDDCKGHKGDGEYRSVCFVCGKDVKPEEEE